MPEPHRVLAIGSEDYTDTKRIDHALRVGRAWPRRCSLAISKKRWRALLWSTIGAG